MFVTFIYWEYVSISTIDVYIETHIDTVYQTFSNGLKLPPSQAQIIPYFLVVLSHFWIDFRIAHPFLVEFPHQTASLSCPPFGWLTLLKNPMFRGWGSICQWQVHQYPEVWNLIFINQMR